MRKLSRRQNENVKKVKNVVHSSLEEAINLLQDTATAKFIESVELHANLNIDPKYSDQQLRTTVTLPHGVGKSARIAVLTNETNFTEAKQAKTREARIEKYTPKILDGKGMTDCTCGLSKRMPNCDGSHKQLS